MAYSVVGVINMALQRIGVKRIVSLTEDSDQAIAANTVYEYIRDEVLSAKDWKFAKRRVALAQNVATPEYGYDYAYTLPSDFLRLCLTKDGDDSFYPSGDYASAWNSDELTIRSRKYGYSIEALSDGTFCMFTDYDNTDYDLYIAYIRKEDNPAKWSPAFINALAFRLAAELALTRTESRSKFSDMMTLYENALKKADEHNSYLEYVEDETGKLTTDNSWERAGR